MISLLLLLATQTPVVGEAPASPPEETLSEEKQPALLTVTTTASALGGESGVTLAKLLDAADKQNIDRRVSVAQKARADAELRLAWSALWPYLTVQGAWVHNQYEAQIPAGTFGPDPITLTPQDQLNLVARVDLPIIDTARWMRTAAAEAARDAVDERQKLTGDQVKRAVATGWYQFGAAHALRASSRRTVEAAEAQLKLQEIRERAGAVTELELLRARAEVERNRQTVADADRMIAIARRNLETLTGIDPGATGQLPPVDLRPPAALADLEGGVADLPAVRAAEQDLRGAEKLSTSAKLALVPIVGAQFTESISNATGFNGQNTAFNFGLYLNWRLDVPTFVGWDVQSANVALASLAVERSRLLSRDQINTDYQTLQAALIKVKAVKAQVEAAQRARDVASTRYAVGASTQIDVIQADRDLFGAEVQQIQAQSDLASARVALQLSAGLPLEL